MQQRAAHVGPGSSYGIGDAQHLSHITSTRRACIMLQRGMKYVRFSSIECIELDG